MSDDKCVQRITESLYVNPFFAGACILAHIPLFGVVAGITISLDEHEHPILVEAVSALVAFPMLIWKGLLGMPLEGGFIYTGAVFISNIIISGILWAVFLTFIARKARRCLGTYVRNASLPKPPTEGEETVSPE